MQIEFYSGRLDAFITNPFISRIAAESRWTISIHKKPMDTRILINKDRFVGASFKRGYNPLTTLPILTNWIADRQNTIPAYFSYYLNGAVNRQIILDIEPNCPKEIVDTLLNTTPWEYAETSLSGKGLHLGLTLPQDHTLYFDQLSVLKGPGNHYEYLMHNHYVVFTMNQISRVPNIHLPSAGSLLTHVGPLYRQWKTNQLEKKEFVLSDAKPNIPEEAYLRTLLNSVHFRRTLAYYGNDRGRYEFACGCAFLHKIKQYLPTTRLAPFTYDETMLTWLVYESLVNYLPPRAKHAEYRNGLPWLLYLSQQVVAKAGLRSTK